MTMNSPADTPFRELDFFPRAIDLQRRADGSLLMRSRVPLDPIDPHLPSLLARNAQTRPQSVWLAQRRGPERQWHQLSYGEAARQVNSVTQALLDRDRPGRAVVVLSSNSLEHAILQMAAMQARMPYVPITPAYSLLTQDLSKLQSLIDLLEPAVVFAQDARLFERALRGLVLPADATRVTVQFPPDDRLLTPWSQWAGTTAGADVAASVASITPDTVAKYLFTSGSTGLPKAAAVTQRMLMTSITMHRQVVHEAPGTPPTVLLDWMPWSHVASGNVMFGLVLADGGENWIDDGKPTPALFEQTLHNLREISPTHYGSVPLGYAMLAEALDADPALAEAFFRRLSRMTHAGARMPDSVFKRMQAVAVRTVGARIPFTSAFGSTETSAAVTVTHWCADNASVIGLPHPGVDVKLVPVDEGRYEIRVRSDCVTPGYLKQPQATAAAFDDEGFFRMGDALEFVDERDPAQGLVFSGRVTEEFKLQSGVFVRVGALRVDAIEAAAGLLTDAVVAGADQAYVGLLAWPNLSACRQLIGNPQATAEDVVRAPVLHLALRERFETHNRRAGGNSRQIHRLLLLCEPPDMGAGEITDKGYVNQRRVLERRALDAERLFAATPDGDVLTLN